MALKELLIFMSIFMFFGYKVVNGEDCWVRDSHGTSHFENCEYGCCDYECCDKYENRDKSYLVVLIVCSVVGGITFIVVTSAVVACCCCCKGCLCYKPGQVGKTIAPAPIHMTTQPVPPNNRLPPLRTPRHIDATFTGNGFNSYYERGCAFVLPGLPPIRDNVGYHSPQGPPNYNDEPRHPPPYDGRQTPPLTLANDDVNGRHSHPTSFSTQRLQPSSPPLESLSVENRSERLPADNPIPENLPQSDPVDYSLINVPSAPQGSLPPVSATIPSLNPVRSPQGHSALPPIQTPQGHST